MIEPVVSPELRADLIRTLVPLRIRRRRTRRYYRIRWWR